MSWSWSRDQDIKTFGLKTETKTKTSVGKTETKTKTFFFKTETKTKTSKSGLETVSRPRHVSRHHIPDNNSGFIVRFMVQRPYQGRPHWQWDWSKSTQARSQESQSQEGGVVFVSRAGYPLSSQRGKVIYGGKRWVFRPERNTGRDVQERRWSGREFQTVGAEKLKERRPLSEVILGMTSKCLLEERR